MTKRNYAKFSTRVLDAIFPYIVQSDLQVLVLQRLDPEADEVKAMILKMQEPYKRMLDEKSRKELSLTRLNKSFIEFLIKKGLIPNSKSDRDDDVV